MTRSLSASGDRRAVRSLLPTSGFLFAPAGHSDLAVLLGKALDASFGVDKLLATGKERMAVGANLQVQLVLGSPCVPRRPARAANFDFVILRMDSLLHGLPLFRPANHPLYQRSSVMHHGRQSSVVSRQSSVVSRQSSVVSQSSVSRQSSVVSRQSSVVSRQSSVVSRQPSAVSRQPSSAVSRQPSAVSRQPSAVSRQPSAVSRRPSAAASLAMAAQRVASPSPVLLETGSIERPRAFSWAW